ncbi:hypothetical protein BDR26DRAFT_59033 [Obelidium mucronatum]|nr:hypothetical protein BDR26DRAFT_59033 [Obelidium mucronatum]
MGITSYFVLFFLAKKQSTNIDLHYPRTKNTIPLAKLKAIYAALSLACVLICINGMGHFAVTSPQHPIRPRLQNTFHPDETSKPLNENAIVTLYSTISELENSYNVQFADTLILAYSLLQSPETRIKPNENVEFIVAVVGDLSNAKRTSLLNLGARLLYLPELPFAECNSQSMLLMLFET